MFDSLNCSVKENYSMKLLNTWRVGGSCKYYIVPKSIQDVIDAKKISVSTGTPLFVVGNGSNVLFDDQGYDGIVLHISKGLKQILVKNDHVYVDTGVPLPKLSLSMAKQGIKGFEFYAGIPGTVGGAITMNAGCLGSDTYSILKTVFILDDDLRIREVDRDHLEMGFRNSRFIGSNEIIIGAKFKLGYGESVDEILKQTRRAADIRKKKFPKRVATAGSTFKSPPEGPYPGQLIEEAGLKGYREGGAQISEVHGNWIINLGNATSGDIKKLISMMYEAVKEKTGIEMELEVISI